MYTAYFGLQENPFSLTPDPRFLFMSQRHREALAHLIYGMGDKGGFVLLTGEVGTGKTTLCRSLLDQAPEGVEVALVLNPKQTALELVASLCDELRIPYPAGTESLKVLIDLLNRHLLNIHTDGRRTVLIIDEAQNLSSDVLEQVRLLTNLETTTSKLLQILLIGQPELQTKMARPELRQLAQRITARYHLSPLRANETVAYVQHRLDVAGCNRRLFTDRALRQVHRLSGGIPRLINTICDRALLGAYAKKLDRVSRKLVRKAASEVMGSRVPNRPLRPLGWTTALAACVLLWAGWQFVLSPIIEKQTPVPDRGPEIVVSAIAPMDAEAPAQAASSQGQTPASSIASVESGQDASAQKDLADNAKEDQARSSTPDALDMWFMSEMPPTDMVTAFEALFQQWQANYLMLPGMNPCEQAAKAGLRCYKSRGNWTTLRHLNRPVILELVDRRQRRHYVTAISLTAQAITLRVGNQDVTLALSEIEPFWFGDFTLLWKPPPLAATVIKEGDKGPDVLWLRAQLARAEGIQTAGDVTTTDQAPSLSPLFDEELKNRIMAFQQANFVKADGIVGEQTLIQLNRAAPDAAVPLLCNELTHGVKDVVNP